VALAAASVAAWARSSVIRAAWTATMGDREHVEGREQRQVASTSMVM
jgi:hypothetical protein